MTLEVIIVAVLMFFVLVGVHEFGHFYFAKRAGILTREFAIGFGPKVLSFRKGETQYTFRLLPMGGYVRMAGEDPELVQVSKGQTIAVQLRDGLVSRIFLDKIEERTDVVVGTIEQIDLEHDLHIVLEVDGDRQQLAVMPAAMMVSRGKETQIAPWDRQFGSKTVGQRAMVIFAGPMMNFILAFFLFFAYVMVNGVPVEDADTLQVGSVTANSPAAEGGLMKNDLVSTVNGEAVGSDSNKLITMISESSGEMMDWTVVRNGENIHLQVTPVDQDGVGRIGISIHPPMRTPGMIEAIQSTGETMYSSTVRILDAIKMLVTLQLSLDDMGGPVRIAEATGEAYSLGISTLLFWIGILSLYLGIFNLLPFPALDGSRLLFFGIEAVRGKPVDPQRESMVHFIGFAMLMVLMIVVTYNDILRLFKG